MQLTSVVFLFLFLPLSLPLAFFSPKAHRRLVLSLLSILWYVLANLNNLWGMLQIGLLVFFTVLIAYLPNPHTIGGAKFRTALLILVSILSLCAARITSEYFDTAYAYPAGLLLVTLGIISYAIDRARGDAVRPRNPLELIGYLLFFPTLMVGPVVRSKHYFDLTEELSVNPKLLTEGIRLYMQGYIKRLAVAAVLMRAIQDLLHYSGVIFSPSIFILLLLLSYFFFYFYISGSTDLARGVCAIYGIPLPRDRGSVLIAPTPDRMLYGITLSLRNYLFDYIRYPLCRIYKKRWGRAPSLVLIYCITALIFRTRVELLLLGAPILLFALLTELTPVRKLLGTKIRWRLLLTPVSILLCSFFTLSLLLPNPADIFHLMKIAFAAERIYPSHYILGAMQDANYLRILLIIFVALLPFVLFRTLLLRKTGERARLLLSICEITFLFVCFVLTMIYFLPQFPSHAEYAYGFFKGGEVIS